MSMIPMGDDNSDRTINPLVTYLLIAANIAVFVLLQGMGGNDRFTYAFSTVPQEIVSRRDAVTPVHKVDRDPAREPQVGLERDAGVRGLLERPLDHRRGAWGASGGLSGWAVWPGMAPMAC